MKLHAHCPVVHIVRLLYNLRILDMQTLYYFHALLFMSKFLKEIVHLRLHYYN